MRNRKSSLILLSVFCPLTCLLHFLIPLLLLCLLALLSLPSLTSPSSFPYFSTCLYLLPEQQTVWRHKNICLTSVIMEREKQREELCNKKKTHTHARTQAHTRTHTVGMIGGMQKPEIFHKPWRQYASEPTLVKGDRDIECLLRQPSFLPPLSS